MQGYAYFELVNYYSLTISPLAMTEMCKTYVMLIVFKPKTTMSKTTYKTNQWQIMIAI